MFLLAEKIAKVDKISFPSHVLVLNSHIFDFRQFFLSMLEREDTGRFLKYDPATKAVTVLIPHLRFPNGVAVSKDGMFVVITETGMSRFDSASTGTTRTGLLYQLLRNLSSVNTDC